MNRFFSAYPYRTLRADWSLSSPVKMTSSKGFPFRCIPSGRNLNSENPPLGVEPEIPEGLAPIQAKVAGLDQVGPDTDLRLAHEREGHAELLPRFRGEYREGNRSGIIQEGEQKVVLVSHITVDDHGPRPGPVFPHLFTKRRNDLCQE